MTELPDLPFYDQPGPLAIAHRGGDAAGKNKENTMPAFQSAIDAGVRYLETDTVATLDKVALAIHGSRNAHQMRKTGLPLRSVLQSMTFKEVQQWIRIDGEKVPALAEVALSFPQAHLYIDPKTLEAVEPLAKLINELKIHERVSVGAFDGRRTQAVASLVGEKTPICTTIGIVGGIALIGHGMGFSTARNFVRHTGASQFALPYNRVSANMVDKAHDLGMRMILWTPNSEQDINHSFAIGADGVMSDRTHLVKAIADDFRQY